MKIYINRQPVTGPWGGGNKTVTRLSERLEKEGHEVVYTLQPNIDVIFCFDPRPNSHGEWYENFLKYKMETGCPIIQRVGDVGTHGKPHLTNLVKETLSYSDFFIFPSEWAKEKISFSGDNCKVIHNGPLEVFHSFKKPNELGDKIKIVTHHWSTNPKKGFDFYRFVDEKMANSHKFEFLYIGQLPEDLKLKNSKYIAATGDNEFISRTISEQDIYLSASEEEAGANHVLEGMACGLPVAYHQNGGSILNYCEDYGVEFGNEIEMLKAIKNIIDNYSLYKSKVMCYNNTITNVIDQYVEVICGLK